MADYYTWIKAVHLISVVILVSGMLLNGFLFRNVAPTSPDAQRIYAAALAFNRYFIGSALLLVWVAGLTLVSSSVANGRRSAQQHDHGHRPDVGRFPLGRHAEPVGALRRRFV